MILTTAALIAQASPAPSASPAAATPDPAVVASARAWLDSLAQGKLLDASALTEQMKAAMTPEAIAGGMSTLKQAGGVKSVDFVRSGAMQGNTFYVFRVSCEKGALFNYIYAVDDASGKISGLLLRPVMPQ